MFEFLEDNCLLEWWSGDFKAWYYKPYRTVIEEALPLTATEGADFSIDSMASQCLQASAAQKQTAQR